ncbi:energy-coupling factor ABC transporter permease [Marinobacter qingdaonensis]|uniref:Energy-coupling factor ABC transporter permease n=1 Tax=Marinobacter qingdaonensis TaxID=3108486 RepID=A0ABU5NVX3_9GAMM|nr:energy-coupling factor ABC transporter permease [Marinobacter sp. ASW11-75]MEA1079955.1 energy-coupling factor ABC transporter permease [Marinobacter sp. ASW11-75]
MGMTDNLLPTSQWLITLVLFALILVRALRVIDWQALRRDNALQHSLFGAAVVLGFLWQLRAGISPGLAIHVFGITVVTLMLGWALAVVAGLLALVITVITGREPLLMFAANGLITVMVPALVSHAIMLWERKRNFRNFFAYIFFCGFFGAGIAVAAAGLVMCLLLWTSGVYEFHELVHEYIRYLPLFMIPEGFVNGTLVTGLMVFHPDRLTTLDQRRYR